ncbi:cannabinoid receptor 1 [Puntigrus tetrazona]|uniref:cannabinoid receptor 1 n=1 Tax=Puntigrus tetrazona TaxID=1606681 RepID=UPI001C8935B1|nr:cannabinoid receptor 1 [Puntigrus tetrazona]
MLFPASKSDVKSVLDGVAETTFRTITSGLQYIANNDVGAYEDHIIDGDFGKSGGYPLPKPFAAYRRSSFADKVGPDEELIIKGIPFYPTNSSDGFGNFSLGDEGSSLQCGENFMDMECFMILTPSQQLAIAVLSLTLGTFTVLENLVVLCVILQSRTLRCRPSYHFIGSLAIADLLGSVIFVYSFLDFHVFHRKDSPNVFLFKLGGVTASFTASVGSLFLTAIDRYVSIHRPLAYRRIVTRTKAVIAFCMMWAISIIIAVLPLLGWNCKQLNSVCSDIFPLIDENYLMFWISVTTILVVFIIYAYMYILWKAHHHAVRMLRRTSQKSLVVHSSDGTKVQTARPDQARMDIRLAKTLVLILAVLVICWGPLLAIMVYDLFWRMDDNIKTVFAFCTMLCLLNSTVNPIIYALRSKDLRRAFLAACQGCRSTSSTSLQLDNSLESDCPRNQHIAANRAAESCVKTTVKIAKLTMSVSAETSAEAV